MRRALGELMNRGLVTNDRFDPLRAGSQAALRALSEASSSRRAGMSVRVRPRRSLSARPEGRWSRLGQTSGDAESRLLAWASVMVERYGVLSREVVALEPSAPPWGELAPLLSRSEWRGELRRGYFVEGLSGVQYASEDAAIELARLASAAADAAPLVLVCTTDPANLYGAGAPLDIELLEGGVGAAAAAPGQLPRAPRRPSGPDHRVVRKTTDRARLGLAGRHRFRTQSSSRLHRTGPANPQGGNV